MQTIFADTAVNISLTGPLIRIELGTVSPSPQQAGEEKPSSKLTAHTQLVMPLEGFLRAFGMQEQVVKKLIADGVIKQAPATSTNTSAEAAGSGLVS
jgi:hypothetical protein